VPQVAVRQIRLNDSGVCCDRVNRMFAHGATERRDGLRLASRRLLESDSALLRVLHNLTRGTGKLPGIASWPPNGHKVITATSPCSSSPTNVALVSTDATLAAFSMTVVSVVIRRYLDLERHVASG
jgi:hypothetical protein